MNQQITDLLSCGEEVTDVDEESFLLFSQDIPTGNLGFIDSHATTLEVTIQGAEYSITQSPTLLSSSRAGGTTGAVLWKITPLFTDWISTPSNPLWTTNLLSSESVVVELGCGISALVALALAPSVQYFLATDQEYVRRLFRTNLSVNNSVSSNSKKSGGVKRGGKSSKKLSSPSQSHHISNVTLTTLDWELDQPGLLRDCIPELGDFRRGDEDKDRGFDLLLSCDCIYNEALVKPFVRTCTEICRLRPAYEPSKEIGSRRPTICIVAQQQRMPDVFEAWLQETLREFRVWRISDEVLGPGLKTGTGYLVHLLLLREK
ncbi:hypothetical protein N7495_000168 [Penicillium taxi]|uniref:uncharacterized protein n=1 Tax=Penicillium taxi TaxID=168475 RepID=UPI0025453F6F|nr:uncharacterized protein N7495_000168 [Penicillium taxi]KAJ5907486.1 hypothetical protein N7495_000168 [Penicillium taxi]